MNDYDIIGDIHGHGAELEALLAQLGYRCNDWTSAYWHPKRRVVFVGDLVDRGPQQRRVLEIVTRMVDAGSAQVVMGNHEFNAIGYATIRPGGDGEYLRPHTGKNAHQHQAFLDELSTTERERHLEWFKTLPLWLDLGGLRVIHACWHDESMRIADETLGGNRFNTLDQFVRASTKGDPLYHAIDVLLKGPEISLAEYGQPAYQDKGGAIREKARICWWDEDATTLRQIALVDDGSKTVDGEPYPVLPDIEIPLEERDYAYTGTVPVFFGHYWRSDEPEPSRDFGARSACVDFSVAKGGALTAYRWSGEDRVDPDHYIRLAG